MSDLLPELDNPRMFTMFKRFGLITSTRFGARLINRLMRVSMGKNGIEGFKSETRHIPSRSGGKDIRVRVFSPLDIDKPLPAMLYSHGGGYALGVPETSLSIMKQYLKRRPCVVVSPDYRKSPSHPFPAGFNDCYDTLLWMKENAESLGILPYRFMLAGHSAGGGMSAALALKARDTKDVDIAFQLAGCPMLDHRQQTPSALAMTDSPVFNTAANKHNWDLYLAGQTGDVSPYASPAIEPNFEGLPPTIACVGGLDPFKDETIDYIRRLKQCNIPTRFELYEGAYHGFDGLDHKAEVSKRSNEFQYKSFEEFYDTYCAAE